MEAGATLRPPRTPFASSCWRNCCRSSTNASLRAPVRITFDAGGVVVVIAGVSGVFRTLRDVLRPPGAVVITEGIEVDLAVG